MGKNGLSFNRFISVMLLHCQTERCSNIELYRYCTFLNEAVKMFEIVKITSKHFLIGGVKFPYFSFISSDVFLV